MQHPIGERVGTGGKIEDVRELTEKTKHREEKERSFLYST